MLCSSALRQGARQRGSKVAARGDHSCPKAAFWRQATPAPAAATCQTLPKRVQLKRPDYRYWQSPVPCGATPPWNRPAGQSLLPCRRVTSGSPWADFCLADSTVLFAHADSRKGIPFSPSHVASPSKVGRATLSHARPLSAGGVQKGRCSRPVENPVALISPNEKRGLGDVSSLPGVPMMLFSWWRRDIAVEKNIRHAPRGRMW
jgi:hypothetical protein